MITEAMLAMPNQLTRIEKMLVQVLMNQLTNMELLLAELRGGGGGRQSLQQAVSDTQGLLEKRFDG